MAVQRIHRDLLDMRIEEAPGGLLRGRSECAAAPSRAFQTPVYWRAFALAVSAACLASMRALSCAALASASARSRSAFAVFSQAPASPPWALQLSLAILYLP